MSDRIAASMHGSKEHAHVKSGHEYIEPLCTNRLYPSRLDKAIWSPHTLAVPSSRILANRSYSALGRRTCQRPCVFSSPPKLGVTGVGRAARSTQTVRVPASPCRKAMFPAAVGSDSLTERAFGVTLNVGNDPMRHRRGRGSLIRARAGFGWLACGGIGGRRLNGSAQPKDRARSGLGGHGQNA